MIRSIVAATVMTLTTSVAFADYLSDLPTRNVENVFNGLGKDRTAWGDKIDIAGDQLYPKGITMHSPKPGTIGVIEYDIPFGSTDFIAKVGLAKFSDNRCEGKGWASMFIYVDGEKMFNEEYEYGDFHKINFSVAGGKVMRIQVGAADGTNECDHSALGDAQFR